MRTLNTNEKLPDYFYVYLHSNRMWHLKWNFGLTKALTSASIMNLLDPTLLGKYNDGSLDYRPFIPNPTMDILSPSSFSLGEVSDYSIDYNAELYRMQHTATKLYPSRFGCLFAFGSRHEARLAVDKEFGANPDDLHKFKLNTALPYRIVKVNMQVITQMRTIGAGAVFDQEQNNTTWRHYWSGGGELPLETPDLKTGKTREIINDGVVWEYLIDGQLERVAE